MFSEPWVFCGGDLAGVAETAVEAVNDGKIGAWSIHRYLQSIHNIQVTEQTSFQSFFTNFYHCNINSQTFGTSDV